MTKEQKALLEKHAEHYQAMASYVRESGDDELKELLEACSAAGSGNCGWDTYHAAQWLKHEISIEFRQRARRSVEARAHT